MAEAHAGGEAGTRDEGRYHALCIDLEENVRKAIKAFVVDCESTSEAHFAVPAVLAGLLDDFMASFGRDDMTVRAACAVLIDSVIAANRDEIAGLVRARRARDGAGSA